MIERQRATALYLIDKLALRAGGEKDAEEEADTVGCCSLRCEHVSTYHTRSRVSPSLLTLTLRAELLDNDQLEFDFLGKDSIRYHQIVTVDHQVCAIVSLSC